MGLRRFVRRAFRGVERTVRRIGREVEHVGRDIGSGLGAVPVVGEVLGSTGLVETPAMKQAQMVEDQEKKQQALLDKQKQEQMAEERWQKEQAQMSGMIQGTQTGNNYNFANALSDEMEDEDQLKKFLKTR